MSPIDKFMSATTRNNTSTIFAGRMKINTKNVCKMNDGSVQYNCYFDTVDRDKVNTDVDQLVTILIGIKRRNDLMFTVIQMYKQ